jgi:hypothetical protein
MNNVHAAMPRPGSAALLAAGPASAALRRQQHLIDLTAKQRQVDDIRMRALRYYSQQQRMALLGGSPAAAATAAVGEVEFEFHRARLFGRNEDV